MNLIRCFRATSLCIAYATVTFAAMSIQAEEAKEKTREVVVQDITLEVPESWKQEEPSSNLRAGQFSIPPAEGDQEPAELSIFFFGGSSGGVDANIERWVKQFEPTGRKQKTTVGNAKQGKYIFVDLTGTYNKPVGPPILRKTEPMPGARSLSVILAVKDKGNYFLRLTGPEKTVTKAEDAFRHSFGGKKSAETPYKTQD